MTHGELLQYTRGFTDGAWCGFVCAVVAWVITRLPFGKVKP